MNTPYYVFDYNILKERCLYLKDKLSSKVKLCYAIKANPFIVENINDLVDYFEICSYGEYKICEHTADEDKMIISGVYKDNDSISEMMENKNVAHYTIESLSQFSLIKELSFKYQKKHDVILRLTSGNQFGMTLDEVKSCIKDSDEYINIKGIQYFSGTQKSIKRISKELLYLDNVIKEINDELNYYPSLLEFGPGFKIEYFKDFNEEEYFDKFNEVIESLDYKGEIILEIGRSIAASCGSYFTKVVDLKRNKTGNYAILDGGMNHIVYYGQMMAMKIPDIHRLKEVNGEDEYWNLCGALCSVNDVLVKNYSLPHLEIGEVLQFKNTGAYCMSEGISLFLSRHLPNVYLKKDNEYICLRDKVETYHLNMKGGEIYG